ncbi:HAD family hydrolase [Zhouia sp. PK063]|uniref:HAD family hydrolase n=1 Tax=Zhouia sp. PK063 TaxID=3373602 RepID=UPI00378C5BB4
MIKNIIFDFGDIFINLDKPATVQTLTTLFGKFEVSDEMNEKNQAYEMGLISSEEFTSFYQSVFPQATKEKLITAWNAILKDFPEERLLFLEKLAKQYNYRLFLLSNTNDLHIEYVIKTVSPEFFERFKNCFEQFYLSQQLKMRKPNADIFEHVLKENNLNAQETLFIDDTLENTEAAKKLGIHVWNLIPRKDDITQLFEQPFKF